jgi:hypothetical protein
MMEHFAWTVSMSSSSSGASFIPFLQILLKEKKTQHSVCIAFISAHFNIVYGLLVVLRNPISTEPYILLLFSQLCPGEISTIFLVRYSAKFSSQDLALSVVIVEVYMRAV